MYGQHIPRKTTIIGIQRVTMNPQCWVNTNKSLVFYKKRDNLIPLLFKIGISVIFLFFDFKVNNVAMILVHRENQNVLGKTLMNCWSSMLFNLIFY